MKVKVGLEDGRWAQGDLPLVLGAEHDLERVLSVSRETLVGLLHAALLKPVYTLDDEPDIARVRSAMAVAFAYELREADAMVISTFSRTARGIAEYVWDHLMGEPEVPSLEDVEKTLIRALNASTE